MVTRDQVIEVCTEVLGRNRAQYSIYKVLVPYESGFYHEYHEQEMFTVNGVKWFTDFNNERIDLGDYPDFYIGE